MNVVQVKPQMKQETKPKKKLLDWGPIIKILNDFKSKKQAPYSFNDLYELDRKLCGYLVKYKSSSDKAFYEETDKFYYSLSDLIFIFKYLGVDIQTHCRVVDYIDETISANKSINGLSIEAWYDNHPNIPECSVSVSRAVFNFQYKVDNVVDAHVLENAKSRAQAKVISWNTGLGMMCWTDMKYLREQMKAVENPDYFNTIAEFEDKEETPKKSTKKEQVEVEQPQVEPIVEVKQEVEQPKPVVEQPQVEIKPQQVEVQQPINQPQQADIKALEKQAALIREQLLNSGVGNKQTTNVKPNINIQPQVSIQQPQPQINIQQQVIEQPTINTNNNVNYKAMFDDLRTKDATKIMNVAMNYLRETGKPLAQFTDEDYKTIIDRYNQGV